MSSFFSPPHVKCQVPLYISLGLRDVNRFIYARQVDKEHKKGPGPTRGPVGTSQASEEQLGIGIYA